MVEPRIPSGPTPTPPPAPPPPRIGSAPLPTAPAGAPQPTAPAIRQDANVGASGAQLEVSNRVSGAVDVPLPPPSAVRELLDDAAMGAAVLGAGGLMAGAALTAPAWAPLGLAAAGYMLWKTPEVAQKAEPALLANLEELAKAPPATGPGLPGGWETAAAAQKILAAYGVEAKGAQVYDAMSLIVTARGGDKPVSAAQQQEALLKLQEVLGLSQPPNAEQLRDLDHYVNTYKAIRTQNPVMGLVISPVVAAATALYTGGKVIGRELAEAGVDPLKILSGGEFTSTGENTSAPSGHEIVEGLKGVVDGVVDSFTKVPS